MFAISKKNATGLRAKSQEKKANALLDNTEAPYTNFEKAENGDSMEFGGKKLTFKGLVRQKDEKTKKEEDLFPSAQFEFSSGEIT